MTTPMIQQYLSIKNKYKDAILFYRMGDFYEMFFEDAEIASGVLEITLTSRNKKDDAAIPMCGVPVRAVQGYIARMIERGYKVAICEQTEDASLAKGLVDREVVRVITPGMIIEDEFLDQKSNNYLLAIASYQNRIGISWLDISTGTFRVCESVPGRNAPNQIGNTISDEVLRVSPSEVLLPESSRSDSFFSPLFNALTGKVITFLKDTSFEYSSGYDRLTEQFKTISLEGFGCQDLKAGISAAGALLLYVRETQKQKIAHLARIEPYTLSHYLIIDDTSVRNLELIKNLRNGTKQGTFLDVMDKTLTSMGGRLLKEWIRYPLTDRERIQQRLDAVSEARENIHTAREIREKLKTVYDLERLGSKIAMGHANARDLIALKRSLQTIPEILSRLSFFTSEHFQWKEDGGKTSLSSPYQLAELIEKAIREDAPPTIKEGGMIKSGYNEELDELIQISSDGKGWIARLEAKEKEKTGISSVKVRYNKVFGYYIEVPRSRSKDVPEYYIRKQTLVNAERYVTDELKSFEIKVLGAEERRAALEYQLFDEIRQQVIACNPAIQEVAIFLARLDCLLSFADIAEQNNYTKPEFSTDGKFVMEEGRHPVIEKMITGERFVPNTVIMDNQENQILMITGPNMAGKSTVLRQAAILALMAQMGSFVPAKKAVLSVTDRIFTRVGALDNLSQGQSTFMVEMQETANILNNATSESLVILDEIGRGTSTFDGISIAWAVAEYLHDLKGKGVKTLFATHYHELTDLALTKPKIRNYNIAVKEWKDEIIFLRKLAEGGTNRSYGIQVAGLAGVPESVITRAKEILSDMELKKVSLQHTESKVALQQKEEFQINPASLPEADGWESFPFQKESGNKNKRKNKDTSHTQLDLFGISLGNFLTEELLKLDISGMTPLDAINYLNELQKKVKANGRS